MKTRTKSMCSACAVHMRFSVTAQFKEIRDWIPRSVKESGLLTKFVIATAAAQTTGSDPSGAGEGSAGPCHHVARDSKLIIKTNMLQIES